MDGLLDWYFLGVVLGLGVAIGAVLMRRSLLYALAWTVAVAVAVLIVALALPLWAFAALAGSTALAWISLRRLSVAALPAAFVSLTALAFVPVLGYVLAGAAPLVGARLGRRAGSRYAGLRILARD